MTFPVPVILKRLATDFFVLMPLGRRINSLNLYRKRAQTICGGRRRGKRFLIANQVGLLAMGRGVTYFRPDEISSFWPDGAGDACDFLRGDALPVQMAGR